MILLFLKFSFFFRGLKVLARRFDRHRELVIITFSGFLQFLKLSEVTFVLLFLTLGWRQL